MVTRRNHQKAESGIQKDARIILRDLVIPLLAPQTPSNRAPIGLWRPPNVRRPERETRVQGARDRACEAGTKPDRMLRADAVKRLLSLPLRSTVTRRGTCAP